LHNGILVLELPEDNMNVFSLTLPIHQEAEFKPINNITNLI
jgi:hypothetical protein